MPTDYLKRILDARVYDVARETRARGRAAPVGPARQHGAAEARGQPAGLQLQAARRVQPDGPARARRARARRDRRVGRQPRAGRRARGRTARLPRGDRDAGDDAAVKIDAVRARGAEVVLAGESYSDAYAHALERQATEGLTFVHPFDDPDVIAGQGTIGMEILRQHQALHSSRPIHAIFVAIGGGGLIAGVGAYVKAVRPDIRIIGVQTIDSDAMARSLAAGEIVTLPTVGLFSDGTAVKRVGVETFRLAQEVVDDIVLVDTDAICAAIKDVFVETRSHSRAGRRTRDRGTEGVRRARRHPRRDAGRDRVRREHELRPAALRRRPRRGRRGTRGRVRGDDPRGRGAVSAASARWSARTTSPSSTTGSPTRTSRTCSSASPSARAATVARSRRRSASTASRRST